MNSVCLHQGRIERYAVQKKPDQRNVVIIRKLWIDRRETTGVGRTIIWRHLHSRDHDTGAPGSTKLDHRCEITPNHINRSTAQPVISAELD